MSLSLFFYIFAVLGLELRAYTLSHFTSHFFVMGFFEIGCAKLFAHVGFEPRSSSSLPPEVNENYRHEPLAPS
jgi:hypothetical protein